MMENLKPLMVLLVLSLQLMHGLGLVSEYPVVECEAGLIQGLRDEDKKYSMFLGIPYAKLDFNNSFGHSEPYPKFDKVFEANNDSSICPQFNKELGKLDGSLDCLILSVYVPDAALNGDKLPVMVWLYEGGFSNGYIGRNAGKVKYLLRQDVILVMPNYRLGPYGFMCLDIPEVPGNQGLKDQVIALKWIKNNIESFGGDANRITLFGSSAGAISIDFHFMYTDESLFHRAILQSGSSVASTVIHLPDKLAPLKLSEYLGMSTDSLSKALSFLATAHTNSVIRAGIKLKLRFKPCIEKRFDGVEAFITESWINVKKPKVHGRDVMLGIAEYEKVNEFITAPDRFITNMNIFRESLLNTFEFSEPNLKKMKNLAQSFYLGDKNISKDNVMPLIEFLSDFTYVYPMHRVFRRYLDGNAKTIFRYMFSYVGGRNYHQLARNFTFDGAVHADELGYIFDYNCMPQKHTPEDQLIIDRVTTMWANFAKYGNPTPEKTNLLPVKWKPVSNNLHNYLKIGSNLTLDDSLFHKRMAFWDLFYMINRKYQKFYANKNKPKKEN